MKLILIQKKEKKYKTDNRDDLPYLNKKLHVGRQEISGLHKALGNGGIPILEIISKLFKMKCKHDQYSTFIHKPIS